MEKKRHFIPVAFILVLTLALVMSFSNNAFADKNNENLKKIEEIANRNTASASTSETKESENNLTSKVENSTDSVINIDIAGTVICDETITVPAGKTLNINSTVNTNTIIRDKNFYGAIFAVESNAALNINNVTVDGGAAWTSEEKINNQGVNSNASSIYIKPNSKANLNNSIFCNNDCAISGSAITIEKDSEVACTDCIFCENKSAKSGGAINVFGKLSIRDSFFYNNYAQNFGGAIYAEPNSRIILSGKLTINENYNSVGKSNFCTNTEAENVLIYDKISKDSKIGIGKPVQTEENMEFAVKADKYNADFGSCRDNFFFDDPCGLTPYCYKHKIIALDWKASNSKPNLPGEGTDKNPYIISRASDMLEINNDSTAVYEIVNDLDFNEFETWEPLCPNGFSGKLNAWDSSDPAPIAYFDIINFTIDCAKNESKGIYEHGLFAKLTDNSRLRDLGLYGKVINATKNTRIIGALSARLENHSELKLNDANIFRVASDMQVDLSNEEVDKQNIIVGGIIGRGYGSVQPLDHKLDVVGEKGNKDKVFLNRNYPNIGSTAGVWDWKINDRSKYLPDNLTTHSGGVSGKNQNSIADVIGMLNHDPDIIEVDVKYDSKKNLLYCRHDGDGYENEVNTPKLETVLRMMMGLIDHVEGCSDNVILNYGELNRIKIQLDVKYYEAYPPTLKLVEDFVLNGRDGETINPKRIEFCGSAEHWHIVTEGATFDYDEKNGDTHRYVRDVMRSLCDMGCIFGINYHELALTISGDDDPINNHNEYLVKKIITDFGLNPKNNNVAINVNHERIRSWSEPWDWLKEYNIGTSAYVVDEEDNPNWNERALFNVTTRSSSCWINYRNKKFFFNDFGPEDKNFPFSCYGQTHHYDIKEQ